MVLQAFIESTIKSLVDNPDVVVVTQTPLDNLQVIQIKVAGNDIARVIGSQGRVFRALRTACNLLAPGKIKEMVVDVVQ